LFVKDLFNPLAHLNDEMIGSVESETVGENESNIGHELVNAVVARVRRVGIGFGRIGRIDFTLNSGKIHGMFHDGEIMRDVESNDVHWPQEGGSVLELLERANA